MSIFRCPVQPVPAQHSSALWNCSQGCSVSCPTHITCVLHLLCTPPRFSGNLYTLHASEDSFFPLSCLVMWCLKSYVTIPLFLIANFLKHRKSACSFSILSFANHLHASLFSFLPDTSMLTSKVTAEPVLILLPNIQEYQYRFYQGFSSRAREPTQTHLSQHRTLGTRSQKGTRAGSLAIKRTELFWVMGESRPQHQGTDWQCHGTSVIYPSRVSKYKIFCLVDWLEHSNTPSTISTQRDSLSLLWNISQCKFSKLESFLNHNKYPQSPSIAGSPWGWACPDPVSAQGI